MTFQLGTDAGCYEEFGFCGGTRQSNHGWCVRGPYTKWMLSIFASVIFVSFEDISHPGTSLVIRNDACAQEVGRREVERWLVGVEYFCKIRCIYVFRMKGEDAAYLCRTGDGFGWFLWDTDPFFDAQILTEFIFVVWSAFVVIERYRELTKGIRGLSSDCEQQAD